MKCLEEICFYQTRLWILVFVIVKKNNFGIIGGSLVLAFVFRRDPYFRFGKIVIFSKDSIDSKKGLY